MKHAQASSKGRVKEYSVVTITCLEPKMYILKGEKKITCQSSGDWSTLPECIACKAGELANESGNKCGRFLLQHHQYHSIKEQKEVLALICIYFGFKAIN